MTASSAVLAGRAAAEALMVDSCVVRRHAGRVMNEETLEYVDSYSTVYSGPCRVRPAVGGGLGDAAGERQIAFSRFVVSLPMSAAGLDVSDEVVVTASQLDPGLVGAVLVVRDVAKGSHLTARRLTCEEVTA